MFRRLRSARGATDPILVIAAIAVSLVLLAGGSFAYAGVTHHSEDSVTATTLSNVALAESGTLNATGSYTEQPSALTLDGTTPLVLDSPTKIFTASGCYAAFAQSQSGTWFYETSASSTAFPVANPWPVNPPSNYATNCPWPASQVTTSGSFFGTVSTVAGSGTNAEADGTGTAASFYYPTGVAFGPDGNAYVADWYGNTIRKVTPSGVVSTFAGSGAAADTNGTGKSASFNRPQHIAADAAGDLFVTDASSYTIRKITPTGVVTTIAGNGTAGMVNGAGGSAEFQAPTGIAVSPDGTHVYVADYFNSYIRVVTFSGGVWTVSNAAGTGGSSNVDGLLGTNQVSPSGIAMSPDGKTVYFTSRWNYNVRELDVASGRVTTLAGNGIYGSVDGPANNAEFNNPAAVAVSPAGVVYVADACAVRELQSGNVITVAGTTAPCGRSDGIGSAASFGSLNGVAFAPDGSLWVADQYGTIRRVTVQ